MKEEIWKDIEGFDGRYQVSNYGRAKGILRTKLKEVKARYSKSDGSYGWWLVAPDMKSSTIRVHKVVAKHFLPNPNNFKYVKHIDGDKANNNVSNLEWSKTPYRQEPIPVVPMYNNEGQEFHVLSSELRTVVAESGSSRLWEFWEIQFSTTGTLLDVYKCNATTGKVNDPYAASVYGRGYLGEPLNVPYATKAKQLWCNMMKRCYSEKDLKGYYGKAFVEERWFCFADFLNDLPLLDNFQAWLDGHGTKSPYNLDKDLLHEGNKIYSKDACSFVTEYLNKSEGAKNARALDKLKKESHDRQ